MKRNLIISAMAIVAISSCQKDIVPENMGVELTISTSIATPAPETKTSYVYNAGTQAGTISTSWDATEKITVVSIGDDGITAVNEFTSTGTAGREKADFSGTWTGNAGDKVICLYPAVSVASRYSGVTVGSTSIIINFASPVPNINVGNAIKDYDIMIGDVNISDGNASVTLQRQISVLKLGVHGDFYPHESGYLRYLTALGVSASTGSTPKLFAAGATLDAKKATYTGIPAYTSYWNGTKATISRLESGAETCYFIPILANGTLETGDTFTINYTTQERYGFYDKATAYPNNSSKVLTSPLGFEPGYVYAINYTTEL